MGSLQRLLCREMKWSDSQPWKTFQGLLKGQSGAGRDAEMGQWRYSKNKGGRGGMVKASQPANSCCKLYYSLPTILMSPMQEDHTSVARWFALANKMSLIIYRQTFQVFALKDIAITLGKMDFQRNNIFENSERLGLLSTWKEWVMGGFLQVECKQGKRKRAGNKDQDREQGEGEVTWAKVGERNL